MGNLVSTNNVNYKLYSLWVSTNNVNYKLYKPMGNLVSMNNVNYKLYKPMANLVSTNNVNYKLYKPMGNLVSTNNVNYKLYSLWVSTNNVNYKLYSLWVSTNNVNLYRLCRRKDSSSSPVTTTAFSIFSFLHPPTFTYTSVLSVIIFLDILNSLKRFLRLTTICSYRGEEVQHKL